MRMNEVHHIHTCLLAFAHVTTCLTCVCLFCSVAVLLHSTGEAGMVSYMWRSSCLWSRLVASFTLNCRSKCLFVVHLVCAKAIGWNMRDSINFNIFFASVPIRLAVVTVVTSCYGS